jgi:hypothetical protein
MKTAIIVLVIGLAVWSTAVARESAEIIDARYLGMGSCFVACPEGQNVLFANPAALDRVGDRSMAVLGLVTTVNSKTADVVGFALDNRDEFENVDDMTEEEQDKFFDDIVDNINYKRMNVMLSTVPFGWVQRSAGGALFTDTRVSGMASNGASNTPIVDVLATQDLGGVFGIGHGWSDLGGYLPNRFSLGADLKYFRRYAYSARETVTELSDADSPELMSGSSVGLDVGLLYDISDQVRLGLAVYDMFATKIEWDGDSSEVSRIQPGDEQEIQPALRVGATYTVRPNAGWLASPILLAFDLAEPFDGDVTFFKKVHMGAEAALFRSWFKARLGVSQGYPSAGVSLGGLTYAYYAAEEGKFAGQIADHRHVLSFGL